MQHIAGFQQHGKMQADAHSAVDGVHAACDSLDKSLVQSHAIGIREKIIMGAGRDAP